MTDLTKLQEFAEIAKERQLTEEEDEELREIIQPYADTLAVAFNTLLDAFKSMARALGQAYQAAKESIDLAQMLSRCPNKRVVHLAKYARKKRTRKKNLHRALRILEKEAEK